MANRSKGNQSSTESIASDGITLPIVGIGASAGGLEAFKTFFRAMPTDSGMAFVLIQHLDPTHESLMVDLLSRCTTMPVLQAEHGQPVKPDHIYMIPPNRSLTIRGTKLQLAEPVERRGMRMAIDTFFRSLAEVREEKAIGIILSGTGSDGSEGLKAIKAQGGLTLVQEPTTADHDGMPRSAMATGLVDLVCSIEEMPKVLLHYIEHPYLNGDSQKLELINSTENNLNGLLALLLTRRGIDFRHYKRATLQRRIERRMGLNHVDTLADYLALLRKQPEELDCLSRDLMIRVTRFFRDPEVFETLEKKVLPKLVADAGVNDNIRVWVPGCATGEEAYTIAMLLVEQLSLQRKAAGLQIFASDIDEEALDIARTARYPGGSAADLTAARLDKHFVKNTLASDLLTVKKDLREIVVFARQNLLADPPFSRLDLISCRNLMIYLQQSVQDKLIELFHFALKPGGYLLLGPSENIGRHDDLFKPVAKKLRLYQRVDHSLMKHPDLPLSLPKPIADLAAASAESSPRVPGQRLRLSELANRWILNEYAPATVIINRRFEILYFCGGVDRYLRYPQGEPNLNLIDMVREGILTQLRSSLQQAFEKNQLVEIGRVRMRYEEHYQPVRIRIKPLYGERQVAEGLLMVSFFDVEAPLLSKEDGTAPIIDEAELDKASASLMRQLEDELKTTKEDLQSTLEEMEASNEELKASNEEMMSVNEELQSTNEELETSREELQSLNEELTTLNNQLQDKVVELEQANNDILNLLNSTEVATLFLDQELCIRRFTPAATHLFHLIPGDIGRPLSDLSKNFTDDTLLDDARRVMEQLTPAEAEVKTTVDVERWFTRRILLYRTHDNKIDGVVVTFNDVTELRTRARQQSLIAELGQQALAGISLQQLCDDAVTKVALGLNVELSKVLELLPDQKELRLQSGVGWHSGYVGSARVSAAKSSQAGFTLLISEPIEQESITVGPVVFVEDLSQERRFQAPALLREHNVVSGLSVTIPGKSEPYGVLGAHSMQRRIYSEEDGDFLRGIAHILASAIERQRVEISLHDRAEEIRTLLDTLPVGVFIAHDAKARRITGNQAANQLLRNPADSNLSKSAVINERPTNFKVYRDGRELAVEQLPVQRAAAGEYVQQELVDHVFDDGSIFHTLVSAAPLFDPQGHTRGSVAAILDISARKRAEDALYQEKERAQVTLASIGDAVITTDASACIEYLNPVAEQLTGWSADEARGQTLSTVFQLSHEASGEAIADPVSVCLAENRIIKLELHAVLHRRDGSKVAIEDSAAPIRDRDGAVLGAVLVFHDVSEQRRLTSEIRHQASHDMLTGLLNRREFEDRLARVISTAKAEQNQHVLLYLDLDQFKIVNDTCGHAAGDELLRQVSELFVSNLRQRDTLARLGGDEFGLLLEHCSLDQAYFTAEKLRRALEDFLFSWEEQSFRLSVSIGLVTINNRSGSLDQVLQAADSACYVAKNKGRNQIHSYSAEKDSAITQHHGEVRWLKRIQDALVDNEFQLYEQRIIALNAEDATAHQHSELLLRLTETDGQVFEPGTFMAAAERFQLCGKIDRWVIEQAFRWLAGHPQYLQPLHFCAINLSGTSLNEPTFQTYLLEQFDVYSLAPEKICFEITETVAITNLTYAARFMKTLKERGCRFALDDFGSGLSSFAYLKNLPVDFLKIDGLFVRDIVDDPIDRAMVSSVNEIAHLMGKQTIAEYVENDAILQHLREIGIDYAQGFAIDRPKPLTQWQE